MFLNNTIEDILKNSEADTEIIVCLDGQWPIDPIKQHPKVKIIFFPESIGQRAATNRGARISDAKYLMKLDAHCSFAKGFDRVLLEDIQDDWTIVPLMRNLHAFDWVCKNGHRKYQGPTPGKCGECGEPMKREILWRAKPSPKSTSYRFDRTLHFQYWGEYKKHQKGDLVETMSLQGSCFMMRRDRYFDLNICDETWGSWGNQGTEVAVKSWLSGGRVIVDKRTWYAHMFRTQGGDFGFPYPQSGKAVERARQCSRDLFLNDKWDKAVHPFSWLINKFKPPDWEDVWQKEPDKKPTSPTKGIVYYTDNRLNMKLAKLCRNYIKKSNLPITSVTLKSTGFGHNIVVKSEPSYKTMFKQILTGLKEAKEDIIFLCEHDVLYHPSHFEFTPEEENTFYYNGYYWMVRLKDGFAINYDVSPLSGLVAYREPLITHFEERVALIEKQGFGYYMGFEPMTHKRIKWENWYDFKIFKPQYPNVDLAHEGNLTNKRWTQKKFIRKPKFWNEGSINNIEGWPNLPKLLS